MASKKVLDKQPGDIVNEIGHLFMELFSPSISKAVATTTVGTRNPEDVGNTKAVPANLAYLLRGVVQQIRTTLKGDPRATRNGRTVYSIKDTKDYYQARFCKLEQKYSDNIEELVVDPQYHFVTSRMEAAFAAFDLFEHLDGLFSTLYQDVTGEEWAPWEPAQQPGGALGAAMVEAAKKAALAKHAELKAKIAA